MQAGAIGGALLSSPFADRKGRKPALLLVAITGFIGGIMQAFSYGHLSAFYIGRYMSLACPLSIRESDKVQFY
jgi:MFS family permease